MGPTICKPTGNPSRVNPHGTEAAGCCVRLAPETVLPRRELAGTYADAYGAYRRLFDGVEDALA